MKTPSRMKLTGENGKQMEEGISLVLSRWRELIDAVNQSWGGPHSSHIANQFVDSVIDFFCQPNRRESPFVDDLEDLLNDGMDSLGVIAVDSVKEVADILMNMYEECLENSYQRIQKLRDTAHLFDKGTIAPSARKVARINDGVVEDKQISSMVVSSLTSLPNHKGDFETIESEHHQQDATFEGMQLDESPWTIVAGKRKYKSRKN